MRFAIDVPHFGPFGDPRLLAELAYEAEEAGWDGFFIWDHINYKLAGSPSPMVDPWVALTAIALRTTRIKLGPMVTPLPRRRPWKLARETVTLDHISQGRLILGVGSGHDGGQEYSGFGEVADPRSHGEMLDEGLAVLTGLWSGELFSYEGKHYHLSQIQFLPRPQQQPRIPIWVAGFWPNKKPFRRAAQWDGVFPLLREKDMTPQNLQDIMDYVQAQRAVGASYDVIASGLTGGFDNAKDAATLAAFAEIGATWWLESFEPYHALEVVRQRIRQGPPAISG